MTAQLFLTYTSLILYLVIGIHVFIFNRKETLNKIFILICLSLAWWAFSMVMLYLSTDDSDAGFWLKAAYFGIFPGLFLVIHFSITLSKLFKPGIKFLVSIYSIAAFLLLYHILHKPLFYGTIIKEEGETIFLHIRDTFAFYLFSSFIVFSIVFCFAIILYRGINTGSRRERKQAVVISATMLLSIILGFLDDALFPKIFNGYHSHGSTIYLLLIWIAGIWYSIITCRFMSINPEAVSNEIILNIDEFVVLIDNEMNITKVNNRIINTMSQENNKRIIPENIFLNSERILQECKNILENKENSFSCRISLTNSNKSGLLIDAKFSAVKDRFKDTIGIVMIGKEVKEMNRLKDHYKISNREAEIIQYILNGRINKEIADNLGITERTVKMHISNILGKLQVSNKTQLFAFLKDFHFIPEYNADKVIII